MGDELDCDTFIGSKRRIAEIEEALLQQPSAIPMKEDSKDSRFLVLSSPTEDQEIIQDIPSPSSFKKVRCSFNTIGSPVAVFEDNGEKNAERAFLDDAVSVEKIRISGDFSGKIGTFGVEEKETESRLSLEHNQGKVDDESCKDVNGETKTERAAVECKENAERAFLDDAVSVEKIRISGDFSGKIGTFGVEEKETESRLSLEHNQGKVDDESCKDVNGETKTERAAVECKEYDEHKEAQIRCVVGENNELPILEESLVKEKKKQLLAEVEDGSIFKEKAHVENIHGCDADAGILSLKGLNDSATGSWKIELIDDTAVIGPVPLAEAGNGGVEVGRKKKVKQETEGKKVKRPRTRRKGKGVSNALEMSGMQKKETQLSDAQTGGGEKVYGMKRRYSRGEMEDLRFISIVEQRKLWRDIYTGLGNAVVNEYEDLGSSKDQKNVRFNGRRQHFRSYDVPGILGEASSENEDIELNHTKEQLLENVNILDPTCSQSPWVEGAYTVAERECSEEYDSDEDYVSIQRPAFLVEGEPDFNSGPPEDGLEYLRRVRWEATHIPKVKVAKLDSRKVNKEQSVYMPLIPDIAKCPEHLLPLKQWEDAFLADFSELRLLLSRNEGSSDVVSRDSLCDYPKLSTIFSMDSVARVSKLRECIRAAESMISLAKNDCVLLFGLCAAVDTPLDADTSASIRSLLRKCASLRATKCELDDEVVMLNILATIAGRYFGQSEN